MDKNTITGFVLIALLLIGFGWYNQPSEEQIAEMARQDSIAQVTKQKAEEQQKKAEAEKTRIAQQIQNDSTALFHGAMSGEETLVVLQNEKIALTFSNKGAIVKKAVVKNYKDREGNKDVTLFDGKDQQLKYMFEMKDQNISTSDLYFSGHATGKNSLVFTADAAEGKQIVITYTLNDDYLLHGELKVVGMAGNFSPSCKTMSIEWTDHCKQQEKGFVFENRYSTLTWHTSEGDTDYLNETSEKVDEPIEEATDWIAFKNQFFSAVMISKDGYQKDALVSSVPQKKGTGYLKDYTARMKTAFDPTGAKASEFEFYYGPNDFSVLKDTEAQSAFGKDLDLTQLVYLGWWIFRFINRWFTMYIFDGLAALSIPMGIVLILITLILKVITFPMVKKSYMSSAKMRVLRPKLDEATKKYDKPEDAMKKQQEMMMMYNRYGVSPMSGCVPMLIQMPIWLAMFNFVPNAIALRGESFLWIDDLSTYDPIIEWSSNIWLIGDHISLTNILFVAANLLYSWFSMKQQKDTMVGQQAEQMKMMQWMMLIMPLMFFFVFNDYSAGLNFYYFISLFCSAAIMFFLRKTTDDAKLLAKLEQKYKENEANPNKKASGLYGRLEQMQRQQEEMERRRQELRRKRLGQE